MTTNRNYIKELKSLTKNTRYAVSMERLTLGVEFDSYEDKVFILSFALLCLQIYKRNNSYKKYLNLSYFIILKYSLIHSDYKPLYDFAVNIGFYPIVNYIIENNLIEDYSINDYILSTAIEDYRTEEGYIPTFEQHSIFREVNNNADKELAIIAPTSYGKSETILRHIRHNLLDKDKFVIVVPNKTLLNEVYRDVLSNFGDDVNVINHDEMYESFDKVICVFTQERALRLLNSRSDVNFSYDVMYIDEAHKIFENDDRNRLLTRLIRLNKEINANCQVIYLSPMISDCQNLNIIDDKEIKPLRILNNIKELDLYLLKEGEQYCYNIYTDKFYNSEKRSSTQLQYIINHSDMKNLIYINGVKDTEEWAKTIGNHLSSNKSQSFEVKDKSLDVIQAVLNKYVHKDYILNDIIVNGVMFLHGQLPDHIRPYLERKFKDCDSIKYLVANSVVMEGVNFPIDNIFIVSLYRLKTKHKNFINLIGRAGRLKYIFKKSEENNLFKLLPKIHILDESGESNLHTHFAKDVFPDEKKNPLLKNTSKTEKESPKNQEIISAEESYFNLEKSKSRSEEDKIKYYILKYLSNLYYINSELINNITSRIINAKKDCLENGKINDVDSALIFIYNNFVEGFLRDYDNVEPSNGDHVDGVIKYDSNLNRLKNENAVKYYSKYIIEHRQKAFYQQVNYEVANFKKVVNKYKENPSNATESACHFYIGETRGECKWKKWNGKYIGNRNVYFNAIGKKDKDLPTYAIAKLKIESDFVKYKLQPFIRFMYDMNLITSYIFNIFIYGTNKENEIRLMKRGFPVGLLEEFRKTEQLDNIDFKNNLIKDERKFLEYYESIEDDLLKFEIAQVLNLDYD
tara:strand:- start:8943 stop:11510 length:2568 start_codon:yes stop_codon:yes gene_type:complete